MNAIPITYLPHFLNPAEATGTFEKLRDTLEWVRHDKVPRSEYYTGRDGMPAYTYGKAPFDRTYTLQPMTVRIAQLWVLAEDAAGCKFDVCFLNRYHDQSDQLGWHADDSPEMDDDRPIAIISLGVAREIMFRENPPARFIRSIDQTLPAPAKLLLEHGSLCLMHAGMQETHQHRIPKAGFTCGERISLTFRGYKA